MTLVAMYNHLGRTVAVADVLLSLPSEYQSSLIELPTREVPYEYKEAPKWRPSGFVQKLTFINEKVVFCWAGSRDQAYLLATYIQQNLTDVEHLPSLLEAYPQRDKFGQQDGQVGGVFLVQQGNDVGSIIVGLYTKRRKVGRFDEAVLFGSGWNDADAFFGAALTFNAEFPDPVCDALIMMGHSMAAQHSYGHGLEDAWGGGFQILRSTDSGFELIDRVLVRAWIATGTGSSMELHRGPFFFYFYINEMLMMCRPFGEDRGSLCSVPPLLKPDYECQFTTGEYKAEYVLDMVRHENSNGITYLINMAEEQETSTVLVAPKDSYVPVSDDKMNVILAEVRSHFSSVDLTPASQPSTEPTLQVTKPASPTKTVSPTKPASKPKVTNRSNKRKQRSERRKQWCP